MGGKVYKVQSSNLDELMQNAADVIDMAPEKFNIEGQIPRTKCCLFTSVESYPLRNENQYKLYINELTGKAYVSVNIVGKRNDAGQ